VHGDKIIFLFLIFYSFFIFSIPSMPRYLDILSTSSILLPFLISAYQYKKLGSELRLLVFFFGFATVVEIVMFTLSRYHLNNLWLLNIFVLTEGFVLCYVLGKWLETRKIFLAAMILFSLYFIFWCLTTFGEQGIFEFNNKEMSFKSIILIFLSGYLLIRLSQEEDTFPLQNFKFWIASAVLIYFSVNLIVFATANFLLEDKFHAMHYSWTIHSIINIIANLLFAYGFLCYSPKINLYS
jgi:hypothetical protein